MEIPKKLHNMLRKSIWLRKLKASVLSLNNPRFNELCDFYNTHNDLFFDYKSDERFKRYFSVEEPPILLHRVGAENFNYGNFHCLNRYSGRDYEKLSDYFIVRHGITLSNDLEYLANTAWSQAVPIITHSKFANESRKKIAGDFAPTFAVGPFIHYAKPIYSAQKISSLKKEFGKTAVIFPSHSHEWAATVYSAKDLAKSILNAYRDYNTIIINTYWADYFSEFNEIMRAAGCKISCCGHRVNPYFNDNLRTVMELADVTAGNDFGSHIGYSIFLNKPFHFIKSETTNKLLRDSRGDRLLINSGIFDNLRTLTADHFSVPNSSVSGKQLEILNPYWGFDCIRTKEEIAAMFEIIQDIKARIFSFSSRVPMAVKKLQKEYALSPDRQTHLRLLNESLDINERGLKK